MLVTFLILVLVAEFGLRWFMGNQMKDQFVQAAKDEGSPDHAAHRIESILH